MLQHYDIIICGAGPAGSTCALALGQSGLKVALIDKSNFPRDKVCGDAVAAYVPAVLRTINPQYEAAFNRFAHKERVNIVRIVAPNTKVVDLHFPVDGAICMRLHLDNFLLEQATQLPNITTYLGQVIQDIQINDNNGIVQLQNGTTLSASMVIGCDGANGICSKKLTNNSLDLKHHSGAVRAYFKNVQDIPAQTFELHYLKDLMPGYFWIFPLPDNQANVGLGMLSHLISKDKINLRAKFSQIIQDSPLSHRFEQAEMISPIQGFGLPLGSRKVTMSGHRFMLCGDAAALIDPLSGEGIGQAMVSGRYAGWQAIECFKKNDFSAAIMLDYNKIVYKKFWRDHRLHYFAQRSVAASPWLINLFANLTSKSPMALNAFQRIFW